MRTQRPTGWSRSRKALAGLLAILLFPGWFLVFANVVPAKARVSFSPPKGTHRLVFSPDSKMLATAGISVKGISGPIQVWDVATGTELLALAESWEDIITIGFSPDNKLLAANQTDGNLTLWDVEAGGEVFSLPPVKGNGGWVSYRFSPDAKFLLVEDITGQRGEKSSVTFWELATKREWGKLTTRFRAMEYTADGKGLVEWERNDEGKVSKLRLWRLGDGANPFTLAWERDLAVSDLTLSPDRKAYATVAYPAGTDHPAAVELWDLESGVMRSRLTIDTTRMSIQSFSFSPDGRVWLASLCDAEHRMHQTSFWDVSANQLRYLGAIGAWPDFSPGGKWLAVPTMNGAKLHDAASLRETANLEHLGDEGPIRFDPAYIGYAPPPHLEFSPDSRLAAVMDLYESETQGPLVSWFSDHVYRVPQKPGRSMVRVWDIPRGRELAGLPDRLRATFSPDSRTMAVVCSTGMVELWDLPLSSPKGKALGLACLAWLASLFCVRVWVRWFRKDADAGETTGLGPNTVAPVS